MTPREAARKVEKKYPGRKAERAYRYRKGYLILAEFDMPEGGKLYTDPWFYVNEIGMVSEFHVPSHLHEFRKIYDSEVPIK